MIPHASGASLQELGKGYGQRNSYAASLSGQGENGRAIRVLMDLLEYYPGDEVTLNNLAGIYIELEDWEKALGLLDGLVESGADRFGIWINLATVQRALGNLPEARRAIDRAVALSPDQSLGQMTRAEICMLQGDTPRGRGSPACASASLSPGTLKRS